MSRRYRVLVRAAAVALAVTSIAPRVQAAGPVFSASGGVAEAYAPTPGGAWDNQTLRQVVDLSSGGTQIRIRLTDAYSAQSAWIGHVTVGTQLTASETVEAAPTTVTFNGSQSVTIPAGGDVVSDPVVLSVAPATRLLVSIYLPHGANLSQAPRHDLADDTEYNYVGGDVSAVRSMPVTNTFSFNTLISGVDTLGASGTTSRVIVAAGDSITDGLGAGASTDTRWTNYLAARLPGWSVLNQGIGGNQVTTDQGASGYSLQNRLARDVYAVPGVTDLLDTDGINDLRSGVSAAALEAAQAGVVQQAHQHGLRVFLSTLTPCAGETRCTAAVQAQETSYNVWVLAGTGGQDGTVDFYGALVQGVSINPALDSGDHLHPNSAGYRLMANCIDLSMF